MRTNIIMKAKDLARVLPLCLATLLLLSACTNDDDSGSADVGLAIKTFFPTKTVTNQPMTINGSGLDEVTEIVFPGGVTVTDFEVVSNDMLRVNAPANIAPEGGVIVVRTDEGQAESRQVLTIGHTNVTGFDKQDGETATGGSLITVYGTDLEFINRVELLDAEGQPQFIDHKDFYRKGTNTLVFRLPRKNIYEGTFVGKLHTYDGLTFSMPELTYEQAADDGHYELVKTTVWKNDGSLGEINWGGDYRFAGEGHSTGEECYTVPADLWEKMKAETFCVNLTGANPQIRVTDGWWSTTWTGNDIQPGNELLTDNGDGTWTLTVTLAGDPLVDVMDAQHLLFTGGGYTVDEIYFVEEVWIDGPGDQEVKAPIWTNDGSLGEINWGGDYRFAAEGHSTGEECYTVPADIWERMKTETFYATLKGAAPQVRLTSGWWSTTWTGNDIQPGNELLTDNGDGTWTLTITLAGDPLLDVIDDQHLLFTGGGYSVEEIYFIDIVHGGAAKEVVLWQSDGSGGEINWNGTYRFSDEGHKTGEEIYAFPADQWEVIKTATFYLDLQGSSPQIRVTDGWWSTTWTGNDIQPGNELLTDNGDGTWTLKVNLSGDPLLDVIDVQHLLFTGGGYTPLRIYYIE